MILSPTELVKLQIIAYTDGNYQCKSGDDFEALINPTSYSRSYSIQYQGNQNQGQTGPSKKFNKFNAETISFKIILDGTGALHVGTKNKYDNLIMLRASKNTFASENGSTHSVEKLLLKLKDTIYKYNGKIHQPKFVQLVWGSMLFKGRLTSMKVEYTLFKPDGTPLRANVSLDFTGYTDEAESRRIANKSSPDLSHLITVVAGDTLPNLCDKIYKDSTYCLEVAKVNHLATFRNLKPGTQLLFPPLVKDV